eukprot:TRINITY_DN420_c0_g1_i2.p1 TRINITY_DN420_c0_g1~~TRINITY_DN420_c0_g1_i2.p1  ORF type:complete len:443 (+),score=108.46 TRINITY_DN420_c0_g1_i2:361-1689(+)
MDILQLLDHPNIVMLYDIIERENYLYLVFEYVNSGDLFHALDTKGAFSEDDARKIMRQIISALEYCHSLLIIHRDLKPENILIDDELNVKIADFGLSNIVKPGKLLKTFCGSLLYASPEILTGNKYIGPGVDIWSLGVILSCLVTGRQPFVGESVMDILEAIRNGITVPESLSDECVDLMGAMLAIDEEDRIPISEIRYHEWLNEGYDGPPDSELPVPTPRDRIDENIIRQLYEFGFKDVDTPECREQIRRGERNQMVVTYKILQEKKKKKKENSTASKRRRRKSVIEDYPDTLFEKKKKRMSDMGKRASDGRKSGAQSDKSGKKGWRLSFTSGTKKAKRRSSKANSDTHNDPNDLQETSDGAERILHSTDILRTNEFEALLSDQLESLGFEFELTKHSFQCHTDKGEPFEIYLKKHGHTKTAIVKDLTSTTAFKKLKAAFK